MIQRRSLNVSLTPELFSFVQTLLVRGTYGNASEIVRGGLRMLMEEDEARCLGRPGSNRGDVQP